MKSGSKRGIGAKQFFDQLFPAELEEICRRRRVAGDDRPLPGAKADAVPSTESGLIGLAFSGGGIRSASFSLGVAQHLICSGLFKYIDYLSTVSGGGYTGSCLSALMHKGRGGERLLVDRNGPREAPALNHLRNGSNYLAPGGFFNRLRMPSLLIVGILQTLLLFAPVIVLLVFLTELFFETTLLIALPFPPYLLLLLGLVPFAIAVFVRPILSEIGSRRTDWERRDQADRRLGIYLLLAVASLVAIPILAGLVFLTDADVGTFWHAVQSWVGEQFALGLQSWLIWLTLILLVLLVVGLVRFRTALAVLILGVLGPLILLGLYVFFYASVANGPVITTNQAKAYEVAVINFQETGDRAELRGVVDLILRQKDIRPGDYRIDFDSVVGETEITQTRLNVHRRADATYPWWARVDWIRSLSARFQDEYAISYHPSIEGMVMVSKLSILQFKAEWWFYLGGLLLWLFNYLFLNVNRISLHPFYRDRLSRTFLIAPNPGGGSVVSTDSVRLSELGGAESSAPYHLINTALNLQGCSDPQLRQRKTVPFLFSKRYCGSDYTGYCDSKSMEFLDSDMNLGTAMAISAAAAGPAMGTKTKRSLASIMTMLNIRLNYWVPHPGRVRRPTWTDLILHRTPNLLCLLTEAGGMASDRYRFVNCSDGGHIENLAVYELLKRRCKTIICVDGEADPDFVFEGLTTLQRYAWIDFGARLEIDPSEIVPDETGKSPQQYAVGTIIYNNGEQGKFIYLKLSYGGDVPQYIRFYKQAVPVFPHESTSDQFFDETRFEVYRALGEHVAQRAFADDKTRDFVC